MINITKIKYLAGNKKPSPHIFSPYNRNVCNFFNDLSRSLLSNKKASKYADIISYAFWCRKNNINNFKQNFRDDHIRLGLGIVFHISPSNVPVNFAYSFSFGLLSGNANIVRVPSRLFPQVDIICKVINNLFSIKKYKKIKEMNSFVRYDHDESITAYYSSLCNARVIWGGDASIRNIRKIPIPARSIEITFADRYSLCLISASSVVKLNKAKLQQLAEKFYNDTYVVDQNACSSPHLIIWIGSKKKEAKEKFWSTLYKIVEKKYKLENVSAIDKYTQLFKNAIELKNVKFIKRYGNYIYRVSLNNLSRNTDTLRGKWGYFYEHETNNFAKIASIVNPKYQTLTYFGVKKSILANFVNKYRLSGIDRIVPIGQSLDIGFIWDGFDMQRSLSRIIEIR